mgnify:CR=1 FL=1
MPKAIYADLTRCIYCRACEVACEKEHNGLKGIFVLFRERFAVPLNCHHCEKGPCSTVCYTQALVRGNVGDMALDIAKCTGCKLCIFACPFGVINFDITAKVVTKCDLCLERLGERKEPSCVATCPSRALYYSHYEDFMRKLKKKAAFVMIQAISSRG